MQRREFITLLGGLAAAIPLSTRAQQMIPVVGVLSSGSSRGYASMFAAMRKGMAEGGYTDGQNVKLEYAFADEQYDRLPGLAASLVGRPVNLIVAATTPAAIAAKPVTSTIPIIFAIGGDPVLTGLVGGLSRPGGNLTGAAHVSVETAPKRLELLHELMPKEKILGLLINPTNPLAQSVTAEVNKAADSLGVHLHVVPAQTDDDIDRAFAELTRVKVGGVVIGTDPFFTSRAEKLAITSLRAARPSIYQYREFVDAGGVMSFGGSIKDSYYRAGVYVARVLKGENPANLPVQLTTKVELFLNLRTAKQLGIDVPLSLLGRADEIIE